MIVAKESYDIMYFDTFKEVAEYFGVSEASDFDEIYAKMKEDDGLKYEFKEI